MRLSVPSTLFMYRGLNHGSMNFTLIRALHRSVSGSFMLELYSLYSAISVIGASGRVFAVNQLH